eukprot:COSAG02_NODE_16911_length_1043_cov_1.206131_1_plen_164_part_10
MSQPDASQLQGEAQPDAELQPEVEVEKERMVAEAEPEPTTPPGDWSENAVTAEMIPDEVWAVIGSFLDVKGLGRLACTNTRFNEQTVHDPEFDGPRAEATRWSLVDEAARVAIVRATSFKGQSSHILPAYHPATTGETWLRRYSMLLLLEDEPVLKITKEIRQS